MKRTTNAVTGEQASFTSASLSSGPVRSKGISTDKVETLSAQNTVGITVPGAISEQKFSVGAYFPTDGQKHVMVLKLMGQVGETKIEAPITVKTKTECPTCGTKNKFGTKFCKECGTGLSIV